MSIFEPDIVRAIIRNALPSKERDKFDKRWTKSVDDHVETWSASNPHAGEATAHAQFTWVAHVVAYVEFLHERTKPAPRSPTGTKPVPLALKIPIYGLHFAPPQHLHVIKRTPSGRVPKVRIETTYLKPINIIHPFYHAPRLSVCPRCRGNNLSWDSWTATGPRSVYGVRRPELALGYQVRCNDCKTERSKLPPDEWDTIQYSYATTSDKFWEGWEYWQIPRGLPVFFHRCAVTRDLLDLIIELRLSSTSAGLAENIKQLHLLEYHQAVVDFLEDYKRHSICGFTDIPLDSFSTYNDPNGWNGRTISGDSITAILLENSARTRRNESTDYLKTLTAVSVSVDATFESTKKAVTTNSSLVRTNPSGGGLFSGINEFEEILFWKLSQTMSNTEIIEALDGLKDRHIALDKPLPEVATADNCCHVRSAIVSVFPQIHVVLDVYHFLMRYAVAIVNGKRNVWYWVVIEDIQEAILIKKADAESKAIYRTKEDQELRLEAAYRAWDQHGGVWAAAAPRVHEAQMNHVRKGCLARHRQDIATDGSRIEGTHKGWNSIMRSHTCGLEVFLALGHDFVLRRNVRVAIARLPEPPEFIASAEGSHHLRLVDHIAKLWNSLLDMRQCRGHNTTGLIRLPHFPSVAASGESFGVVRSFDAESYGGLLNTNEDDLEVDLMDMIDQSEIDIQSVSSQLQIEPDLFLREGAASVGTIIKNAVAAQSGAAPSVSPSCTFPITVIDPALLDVHQPSTSNFPSAYISAPVDSEDAPTLGESSQSRKRAGAGSSSREGTDSSDVVDLTLDDECEREARLVKRLGKQPLRDAPAQAHPKRNRAEDAGAQAEHGQQPVKKARFAESEAVNIRQSTIVVRGTQLGRTAGASGAVDDFFKCYKPPSQGRQATSAAPSNCKSPLPTTQGPTASPGAASPVSTPAHADATNEPAAAPAHSAQAGAARNGAPTRTQRGAARARNGAATSVPRGAARARNGAASSAQSGTAGNGAAPSSSPANTALPPAAAQTASLMSPLPLPSSPAGLTRTERMWSFLSAMDAHSMVIERGMEYLVFMEVREAQQWSMASMTPRKWVVATQIYNEKLHEKYNKYNLPPPVLKHPRALVDHLDEVEDKIIARILKDDYMSRPVDGREPTDIFWRRHCHAVPGLLRDGATPKRRPPKCGRCRILKYTTGVRGASNHRRDCCSDGVRSRIEGDKLPPWPQPPGIFENGTTFSVPAFFNAICKLYDHTVLHRVHAVEFPLEYQAFMVFLMDRLIIRDDGAVLFPLYEHTTNIKPEPQQLPPGLLVEFSGARCLKVPQLSHDIGPVARPVASYLSVPRPAATDTAATNTTATDTAATNTTATETAATDRVATDANTATDANMATDAAASAAAATDEAAMAGGASTSSQAT